MTMDEVPDVIFFLIDRILSRTEQ